MYRVHLRGQVVNTVGPVGAAGPAGDVHGHRILVLALASYCIRKSAHVGALVVLFFVGISALDLLHAIYSEPAVLLLLRAVSTKGV